MITFFTKRQLGALKVQHNYLEKTTCFDPTRLLPICVLYRCITDKVGFKISSLAKIKHSNSTTMQIAKDLKLPLNTWTGPSWANTFWKIYTSNKAEAFCFDVNRDRITIFANRSLTEILKYRSNKRTINLFVTVVLQLDMNIVLKFGENVERNYSRQNSDVLKHEDSHCLLNADLRQTVHCTVHFRNHVNQSNVEKHAACCSKDVLVSHVHLANLQRCIFKI